MSRTLYLFAVLPSKEIGAEMRALKEELLANFGLRAALRSPAHITIVPPFSALDADVEKISSSLWKLLQGKQSIEIAIDGFSHFDEHVIFAKPADNAALTELYESVNQTIRADHPWALRKEAQPFRPHITVAYRDLTPELFGPIWKGLSPLPYQRTCTIQSVFVLKHNGRSWDVWKEIPFSAPL